MKKTYIAPTSQVIETQLQLMGGHSIGHGTASGSDQLSRERGDWDDEE